MRAVSILASWLGQSSGGNDTGDDSVERGGRPSLALTSIRVVDAPAEDREIAERLRNGDVATFDTIVLRYYPALCAFAARLIRSSGAAEELVQDVFAAVWINREGFMLHESIRAYLYAAVRNRALKNLRHERVVARHHREAGETGVHAATGSAAQRTPDRALEQRELAHAIDAVATTFPVPRRDIFYLRWQGGLTYPEIAQLLGLSVKTVEMHLTKAFRVLRRNLEGFR